MSRLAYTVVIEEYGDGGFLCRVPGLPGCQVHGRTVGEVVKLIQAAVPAHVRSSRGRPEGERATSVFVVHPDGRVADMPLRDPEDQRPVRTFRRVVSVEVDE